MAKDYNTAHALSVWGLDGAKLPIKSCAQRVWSATTENYTSKYLFICNYHPVACVVRYDQKLSRHGRATCGRLKERKTILTAQSRDSAKNHKPIVSCEIAREAEMTQNYCFKHSRAIVQKKQNRWWCAYARWTKTKKNYHDRALTRMSAKTQIYNRLPTPQRGNKAHRAFVCKTVKQPILRDCAYVHNDTKLSPVLLRFGSCIGAHAWKLKRELNNFLSAVVRSTRTTLNYCSCALAWMSAMTIHYFWHAEKQELVMMTLFCNFLSTVLDCFDFIRNW